MDATKSQRIACVATFVSWGLFIASLYFRVFFYGGNDSNQTTVGWQLLCIGWIGFLNGPIGIITGSWAWGANPLFVACTSAMVGRRYKFAVICGAISAALAASTLLLKGFS